MNRASTLGAGLAVLLGATAFAAAQQSSGEDPDLARALVQRGWFDLADELCDRIQRSSSTPPEAHSAVPLLRAEIALERGERESDAQKSKQHFADAAGLLKKFVEGNPSHPQAQEARFQIGWIQGRRARTLAAAVELEPSPDRQVQLRQEANEAFLEAEKYLQETIAELKAGKQTEESQNAVMDARLELPRTLLEHAKLGGTDEAARKRLLTTALALLSDFEFDYGDRPIAFEATLEGGRAYLQLGDFRQAEKKLRDTLALRQRLAEAKIRPNEYHNRIIYGAWISLAQTLVRAGKPGEARKFIDDVMKENKGLDKEWVGPALKLEKADALFRLGDFAGANALANDVMKSDPNGRFGFMARERIKNWAAGSGGGFKLTPDQALTAAEAYLARDQYREALASLRRTIELCANDAEREKYAAPAYYKMGECFLALRRPYEAAVAFENVFTLFRKHELAAKACYEVVRCYNAEFALSGDKRDDEAKKKYISLLTANWPGDKVGRNLVAVQAEELEKMGELKKAAELYLKVGEDAEAYENSLVAGGYCYRIDGTRKWEKNPKDPAVQREVREEFRLAEEALKKFLARVAQPDSAPANPELARSRAQLTIVAQQELAYLYMHEAVGRAAECLKFLEQVAREIPKDDERLARIWSAQIQAHLTLGQVDAATRVLDLMFEKFPDAPAIARASKSVAIRLDEATSEMIKNKADPAAINENLKRISRYYAKWLNLAPALQMRITVQDVLSVAETLYMIAKRINGLDENVISFLDLKGKKIPQTSYWDDAAFVHTLLVEGKVGRLPDRERILLMTRLARCFSFTATDAAGWEKAKEHYDAVIGAFKFLDASGRIDVSVLQKHRELLGVYLELGYVFHEIGRLGQKFQFDNAMTVFSNVLQVTESGSEPWWIAKYMVLSTLYERGGQNDIKLARVGMENLQTNNPDFDGGKFGMKDRCIELKNKINQVSGGR